LPGGENTEKEIKGNFPGRQVNSNVFLKSKDQTMIVSSSNPQVLSAALNMSISQQGIALLDEDFW
jgi:hypothetical protein